MSIAEIDGYVVVCGLGRVLMNLLIDNGYDAIVSFLQGRIAVVYFGIFVVYGLHILENVLALGVSKVCVMDYLLIVVPIIIDASNQVRKLLGLATRFAYYSRSGSIHGLT